MLVKQPHGGVVESVKQKTIPPSGKKNLIDVLSETFPQKKGKKSLNSVTFGCGGWRRGGIVVRMLLTLLLRHLTWTR